MLHVWACGQYQPGSVLTEEWEVVCAVAAEWACNRQTPTDCARVEAVAAKAHAHAVPSRAVDAELRNSLLMLAGLVMKSAMDHAQVEVREELGLVWGDRNSEIPLSVYSRVQGHHVRIFVAFR